MEYPKEILVKDYFDIHDFYSNIYGNLRTIILMQVGSFHECYSTDSHGLDLVSLSQQLDVVCTKKNGNLPLSKSNPRMMGFPTFVTHTFIDKLIDLNYTVVLIDQVTEPPNPTRKVIGIYSPATHITHLGKINKSFYLVSIVLDKIKDNNNSFQLCIGLSAYDLSTGEGCLYETYSKSSDMLIGLDNALRFLENYPPREIILDNNINEDEIISSMKISDILSYLNIKEETTYKIKINQHKKISYQQLFLTNIYKYESNINIIEHLNLQYLNWARLSLVLLLDYAKSHQPTLLDNLRLPKLFNNDKYLYLGNKALDQLDITTKLDSESTNLFNIINNTKTNVGKRYLSQQLALPLIDSNELNKRYNAIDKLMSKNHQNKLINWLEDIYDLDKLIRKVEINIINPYELYQIYISYYQIYKLSLYLEENNLLDIFDINKDDIKNNKKVIDWIESKFELDKINGLNFTNFVETDKSFYLVGIHKEIDELQNKINTIQNFMNELVKILEKYIDEKVYLKKSKADTDDKSLLTLKFNERDGHYLLITNRRCDILKKNLEKIGKFNVGSFELKVTDLEFIQLPRSLNTKINCLKIKELSNDLVIYKNKLATLLKTEFRNDMKSLYDNYINILYKWSSKIGYIDFINSGALIAIKNHYSKPIIKSTQHSYFKAIGLRHPIIERLNTEITYKPHDIELGYDTNQVGILLYGINSSGKSTLMKSIGLNIILAQIGYYTAATNFEYSPYKSLFTRISGNDNMFKGLSSFMVEMMELISILKRNDSNTLVIADEICRGTEILSASTIVCYMLEKLSESNTSFITATHLHNIAKLETVTRLSNVKSKHLKITYDSVNDMLIYDRHLSDGQGESFYGLQVAKYLMKDKHFNERTLDILNEYNNHEVKQSKYNDKVYLECCEICKNKDNLETHHITWQKDFNNDNINMNKFHLQKNDPSNLLILCMSCHDKVDRNEIIINGWINTTNGRKLDYELIKSDINKNSKYDEETIKYIKKLKSKVNNDEKLARIKIKEKLNIRISTKTILKYWNK